MGKNFSYIKSLVFDFKIENEKKLSKNRNYVYLACSVYVCRVSDKANVHFLDNFSDQDFFIEGLYWLLDMDMYKSL